MMFLFFIAPSACGSTSGKQISVSVDEVHDGDTFKGSNGISYRLFGVDTPEISDQYHNWAPTTELEHYYAVLARDFVRTRIEKHVISAITQVVDKYSRQIVKITFNHEDLGLALIKSGLARVAYIDIDPESDYFTADNDYYNQLVWAQYEAYSTHLAIWSHTQSEIDAIFPKATD